MHPALAWPRMHWRWLAGAAALLVLYALAGFFLVPRLARGAIEDFVTQRLERQVTIGDLKLNPFTLTAQVTDFRLAEADGRPLVGFADLLVNVQLSTLWNRALTFAEIRLIEPGIDAVINADGSLNLASLVPESPEPRPSEPADLPAIRIGLLEVGSGRIGLEDRTRSTPFRATVTPIQFTLNDFRTEPDYQNAYRFAGTTQAGEQLEWSGQFSVQPLGSTGTFSVAALKASTLWAYVRDQVAFTLPSGNIDLSGTYNLAVDADNRVGLDIVLPRIRLSDFAVAPLDSPDTDPWITIPELVLADTRLVLGDRRLTIGKVNLNGARATLWRDVDGSVNLSRLARATEPPVAVEPRDSTPWQAEIGAVEIRDASIEATDRGIEPAVAFSFSPIAVTLTDVYSDLARPFAVNADIGINGAGRLQANGNIRLRDLLADFDVTLTDFGVPVLQPYIGQATAMTVGSGRFGLDGHITYAAQPAPQQSRLSFTGSVDLADFASQDDFLQQDFLKAGLLSLTGIDYSIGPDRLTIDRILARDPYARVVISPEALLNVTQVLSAAEENQSAGGPQPEGPTGARSPAPSSPVMPVRINTVVVENGSADFADYSLEPSFATGIQSLAGTVQGLSSNASTRAKVDLKGAVDRFSPVVIAGEVNLLSAALYTDIAMSFSNMELTTFNPYSGKFAGYNIARGKLTTELNYKVENRQLEAEHHIVLDQLEFGAATDSKDAVPLPIKLAVALLKDRNGVIDINLPVRGSLDDPSFRLGPIIWQAVVGLMRRIVTAPFALLGSLFGGGEDLAFVDFSAGSAQLSPESAARLGNLTRALAERPQLRLDIPLNVTTAADAEAMAREALAQNVLSPATPAADELGQLQQQLQALTLAHTRLVGTAPALPVADATPELLRTQIESIEKALLASLAPTTLQLETLARSRAEAVRDALLGSGEIAPERIFLTTRELAAQEEGAVRMELKLDQEG